jgi:hypothetical protein
MHISRREFVKSATISGIALSFSPLAMAEQPDFAARETLPGRQRWNPAATGSGRIDGVPKVTGSKLYAADFRVADLPGWPAKTSHALLLRANDATHVYTGLDLSRLTGDLKPSVVVTADDLAHWHTRSRILRRGSALPGRHDAGLSRPAHRLAGLRGLRCLRSGAARATRHHVCEIRQGDWPDRKAAICGLSFYPGGWPKPGVA